MLFSIVFLIVGACIPLPYGAYILLKFVVCFSSIREIYVNSNLTVDMTLLFIALAVLYNPIIKIPLGKPLWIIVNVLTAGIFIYYLSKKTK